MNNKVRIGIVLALVVVVGAVLYGKRSRQVPGASPTSRPAQAALLTDESATPPAASAPASEPAAALPRLVCVGAGKCIPCKAMEPVREALKKEYSGKLVVEFYDITRNEVYAEAFRVQIIPTSIFYDTGGKEVDRFEGFIGKEDILAKFKAAGVTLE